MFERPCLVLLYQSNNLIAFAGKTITRNYNYTCPVVCLKIVLDLYDCSHKVFYCRTLFLTFKTLIMKKIFSNNRLIAFAFFTVFSLGMSSAVQANDKNNEVPVELKCTGIIDNQLIFQLVFSGDKDQNEFTVFIRDEYGNSIYRENIKGESFSKRFLFYTDEVEDNTLTFEIMSNKTRKSVIYHVKRNSRFIQEFSIVEQK
jgi:hypothetical protein